jgi:hypothetical protein
VFDSCANSNMTLRQPRIFCLNAAFCTFALILLSTSIQPQSATPHAAQQTPPATFDLDKERQLSVPIDGLWRFQTGDDPDGAKGWASPAFDDSQWPLIRANRSWSDQGFKNYGATAWYRAQLLVPANAKPLALSIPLLRGSYQVFANGELIASQGGLPPREYAVNIAPGIVFLPPFSDTKAHTLELAIRVWNWPHWAMYNHGGIATTHDGGILIGDASLVRSRVETVADAAEWRDAGERFLALLELLAGLASLALYFFGGREREYLWFGLMLLASAAGREYAAYRVLHVAHIRWREVPRELFDSLRRWMEIFFFFRLLGGRRDWLYWIAIGSVAGAFALIIPGNWPLISVASWVAIGLAFELLGFIWLANLLIRRAIQGYPDARLLLAPVLLRELLRTSDGIFQIAFRWTWISSLPGWITFSIRWPFPMGLYDIIDILFLVAMLAILLYRFTRNRRQEEDHKREREAARSVQQVLIPEAIPNIQGFQIASIYKPFGEVGGDFFQIIPIESGPHQGSVLIAIGDVSGKGLPAAMTVSLLVGTVRTLANYTQNPGEILAAMNQRMVGRNNGGFTTCLVLRADQDGTLTIANAGHLAPYVNGSELPLENGLPLGLAADVTYSESTSHLTANDRLTLITDGVLEARSKTGELFGFERTAAISTGTAESIAKTAQAFGQDDDITTLTVRLSPVMAPATPTVTATA